MEKAARPDHDHARSASVRAAIGQPKGGHERADCDGPGPRDGPRQEPHVPSQCQPQRRRSGSHRLANIGAVWTVSGIPPHMDKASCNPLRRMLALAVRAVLTFHTGPCVAGLGPWTTSPKGRVSPRLTGSNPARTRILH
jgi:hypothetical protein